MEYPPWLPEPEYSRAGMVLALARCIYELHYREEHHRIEGRIYTFDNLCTGDLERTASVLQKVGITTYIDAYGRRSVFNCDPGQFEQFAKASQSAEVSDEEIEEAVIRLASGNVLSNLEIKQLAQEITDNR